MIDTIKKTLLAGIGAAVITKEKVDEALADYVRQGKVRAEDARIIADKIADQGRKEFEDLSQTLGAKVNDLLHRSDQQTSARLAALEERVRILESRLAPEPTRAGEP